MLLLAAGLALRSIIFTVPHDTTAVGLGPIAGVVATCSAADSAERPLALFADPLLHAYRPRASGLIDTAYVVLPADWNARMVWVRAYDFHGDWRDDPRFPSGNVADRSSALVLIQGPALGAPTDTLIVSTRGRTVGPSIRYTTTSPFDPVIHFASFAYPDSMPAVVPPFAWPVPAAIKYETAMDLWFSPIIGPLFGYTTGKGMRIPYP